MKLSAPALAVVRQVVTRTSAIDDAELDRFASLLVEQSCAKGDRLLRAGDQARITGIVVEGVQGEFYESQGGMRKAKWLAMPGDVFGSLEDLVRTGGARASIEALTDGRVVHLPYAQLREMALREPAWSRFFITMMESLYRRKSEREYTLLMLKAPERYRWFRERYGALEDQLPQDVIASYLGITPVHLSRVRKVRSVRGE